MIKRLDKDFISFINSTDEDLAKCQLIAMKFRRYLKRASTHKARSLQPALNTKLRSAKTPKTYDGTKAVKSSPSDEHAEN